MNMLSKYSITQVSPNLLSFYCRGVKVIIPAFQAGDPGSIPGGSTYQLPLFDVLFLFAL